LHLAETMVRRHAIRVLPTPASWALYVVAVLAGASAEEDPRGAAFMRREDNGLAWLDGNFLGEVGRHDHAASLVETLGRQGRNDLSLDDAAQLLPFTNCQPSPRVAANQDDEIGEPATATETTTTTTTTTSTMPNKPHQIVFDPEDNYVDVAYHQSKDNKLALSIFAGEECTVDEMTQINVYNQDLFTFLEGGCAEARVLLNGDNDKPWTVYVKLEAGGVAVEASDDENGGDEGNADSEDVDDEDADDEDADDDEVDGDEVDNVNPT